MNTESVQPLIHRHLDGNATPEEASRLALALLEDPAVARAFAQATRLEAGLRTCFQGEVVGRRLIDSVRFDASQRRTQTRSGWAAAAASLVVAGLSLAWWRPWARPASASAPALVATADVTPRVMTEAPAPPPSLRRPGTLSAAAREVQRLAARYWLPDPLAFVNTPLEEAVRAVQVQASAMNHRQNGIIAAFAIDLPEAVAARPITAARSGLPLGAWLELLSSQSGCELRFTESGVSFDPVERPEALETRRFALPTIADAEAPAESPARLFSATRPWDEEPVFRSAPPQAGVLAAAWGIPLPARTRVVVKDPGTLEVRHNRRELRRIEGLLAVATSDAGRPMVTFRAKEVPLSAAQAFLAMGQANSGATTDDYVFNLTLPPEVVEVEGFIMNGVASETQWLDSTASAGVTLLKEYQAEQTGLAAASPGAGNRVVSNDEAVSVLSQASNASMTGARVWSYGYTYDSQGTRLSQSTGDHEAVVSEQHFDSVYDISGLTALLSPTTASFATSETASAASTSISKFYDATAGGSISPEETWQQTVHATARLGESAVLATNPPAPVVAGKEMLNAGFSLLDLQPQPLTTTARLEGELIKLTGSYVPTVSGAAPTDFEAYVSEGQSFILQTEDAVVAAASPWTELARPMERGESTMVKLGTRMLTVQAATPSPGPDSARLIFTDSPNPPSGGTEATTNDSDSFVKMSFSSFSPAPKTLRGVVISPYCSGRQSWRSDGASRMPVLRHVLNCGRSWYPRGRGAIPARAFLSVKAGDTW